MFQCPGRPCGDGVPGHPPAYLPGTHLALAHLWRSPMAPLTWQACITLSRGTGARWLHPGLYPSFSSSRYPPLRWQRGVTQGQTPSGVTQIQPLAELLSSGPATSPASGGEVTGSGGHSSNSPGARQLLKPCAQLACSTSAPECRAWAWSPALTGSQWQPPVTDPANEGKRKAPGPGVLAPQQALWSPQKQGSPMAPIAARSDCCQHLAAFTHTLCSGGLSWGHSSTRP